jgi:ribosome-associated protein
MKKNERQSASLGVQLPSALKSALHIANIADEAKGEEIKVLDVSKVFGLSDYFVLISGRSDRHVQGICNRIFYEAQQKLNIKPLSIEGFDKAHWVLADYNDVIVHTFYKHEREHYDIESLWADAIEVDWKKEFKNISGDDDKEAA